jgi:hypothetical protein
MSGLFLRHIRKFDKFTSVRERDPRISHACKIFTLLRVVRFFCKRLAFGGRFPWRLDRISSFPVRPLRLHALNATITASTAGTHFLLLELHQAEMVSTVKYSYTSSITARCCARLFSNRSN